MYYEIRGHNAIKPVGKYCDVAYNKSEKNALIKQYKEYLKTKELDMFKVTTYRDNDSIKEIITYFNRKGE